MVDVDPEHIVGFRTESKTEAALAFVEEACAAALPSDVDARTETALACVREYAAQRQDAALATLSEICAMSALSADTPSVLTRALEDNAMIAIHFHPDRHRLGGIQTTDPLSGWKCTCLTGRCTCMGGRGTVADSLLASGVVLSQFATGVSNGRLDHAQGGERDRWENALFGGAYAGAPPVERPKYGALATVHKLRAAPTWQHSRAQAAQRSTAQRSTPS